MIRKSTMKALVVMLGLASAAAAQTPVVATANGAGVQTFALLAGQSIEAGSLTLQVSGTQLAVTYDLAVGWELAEAQLWIGNSLIDLPQTKTGNPVPGQFPYKSGALAGRSGYTFSVPLATLNFSCPSDDVVYYLAAHASVRRLSADGTYQAETAWSAGSPITSRGNWATFSTFSLTCLTAGPPEEVTAETAFAYMSGTATCFNDLGFSRWGWTNGPLGPGRYTMDIYAGAGQCDLSKGTLVGTLAVDYNGTVATVTYTTTGGWWLQETQLYVGNTQLPLFKQGKNLVQTVAPGQYPHIHDDLQERVTTDTFTVNATGSIYIVAHAVTARVR